MVKTILMVIAVGALLVLAIDTYNTRERWRVAAPMPAPAAAAPVVQGCPRSAIRIKSMQARVVDECKRTPCPAMRGVAVLTNTCADPVAVQLKIVGLDRSGQPVATRDFWPASTSDIPPGDYTLSLDHALDPDPRLHSYTLEPIRVERSRIR